MTTNTAAKLTIPVGERDHIQGPTQAPVTLVEYGDYECPSCGQAYVVVKKLQRLLGDRLRFVFRNFPLTTPPSPARCGSGRGGWSAGQVLGDAQSSV